MGGTVQNTIKRGWNRKAGRGNKDFKKVGQAWSMGACLKKGSWDPLANYESNTYRRRKLPTIQQ